MSLEASTGSATDETRTSDPTAMVLRLRHLLGRAVLGCRGSSGSLFLLEPDGAFMRGALGVWDWIRTSFRVPIEAWPSVSAAIAAGRAVRIDVTSAAAAERDWFAGEGIGSCIAAPMVTRGRAYGVWIVDFAPGPDCDSPDLLLGLTEAWARTLEAACREAGVIAGPLPAPTTAAVGPNTPVASLMTHFPVMIGTDVVAHVAMRLAAAHRVHHLLVVEAGRLRGRICVCELEAARPGALVSELMRGPGVSVPPELGVAEAARTFQAAAQGCLPVVDGRGVLVGVLTGRDLRRAGALVLEAGVDTCSTCGATHGLVSSPGHPAFCADCARVPPRESSVDWLYYTLGGSG